MIEARRIISTQAGRLSHGCGKGERDRRRREPRRKAFLVWQTKSCPTVADLRSAIIDHRTVLQAQSLPDLSAILMADACIGYFSALNSRCGI